MDESLWELMGHGGGAMWVVLGFSIAAVAVAILTAVMQWNFVTRARSLGDQVTRCLSRGALDEARAACARSPSPMADIFLVGYERLGRAKPEHVVTAVNRERLRVNQDLRSRLWMLGTVGATAPFVGLFGTVIGIIVAMKGFKTDEVVKFGEVSGPISQALIVTAAGIVVAVMAVVMFNFFSQRAGRIAAEMRLLTEEFLELLLDLPEDSKEPKGSKKSKGDSDGDREAA